MMRILQDGSAYDIGIESEQYRFNMGLDNRKKKRRMKSMYYSL